MIEQRRYGTNPLLETRSEALEGVDRAKRYSQITNILAEHENGLTAKEIAVEMYNKGYTPSDERNFSSPRLTEMLKNGIVDVIGKKKCEYSKKKVAVFVLR